MGKRLLLLPIALALAVPVAAQDGVEKDFKTALQIQNERELEKACRAIVSMGHVDGAKLILSGFAKPNLEPDPYWILIRAAAAFQNSNALAVVAKYVVDNKTKSPARDITMALHNNFSAGCEEAMCTILEGGTEELRVSALDHLMDIGKKPAVASTIEVLKKDRATEVRRRCFRLLQTLTKQDFGESDSNWTGWWESNKDKPWDQLTKDGGGGDVGTTTLGNSRQNEYDKLKEAKVLVIRAGDHCKCKKDHDLDSGIDQVLRAMPFATESVTKDVFEGDPKGDYSVDNLWKNYIAIIAICTHIREHCACPTCKPGGKPNMRLYQ